MGAQSEHAQQAVETLSIGKALGGTGVFFGGVAAVWGRLTGISYLKKAVHKHEEALVEIKTSMAALPTKEDWKDFLNKMNDGFERIDKASEDRTRELRMRLDNHIDKGIKPEA